MDDEGWVCIENYRRLYSLYKEVQEENESLMVCIKVIHQSAETDKNLKAVIQAGWPEALNKRDD